MEERGGSRDRSADFTGRVKTLLSPPSSSSFSSVVLEITRKLRTIPSTKDEDEKLHWLFTQCVQSAGPSGGLKAPGILNHPTAAGRSCGINPALQTERWHF